MKKNLASRLNREERLALVDKEDPELPLTIQADLRSISRSSLYYRPVPPSPREIAIKHRIDEIYTAHPYYSYRRITAIICRAVIPVNRKTVQRYMQEMGIAGISPGPHLSKRNTEHRIYPYLLRNVTIDYPNHVWGIYI